MTDEFPKDVSQFLLDYISSVAQLETLLLMRSTREQQWTASEVSKTLYTTPEMAAEQLTDLRSRGLLSATAGDSDTKYQYWPATPELDAAVERLAETYKERRVAVITAIYSRPLEKVRTFADAFRFRKDK